MRYTTRRKLADFVGISIIVLVVALFVFAIGYATWQDAERNRAHNQQQVAECRAAGGFARTATNGELLECSLPAAR